MTKRPLVLAVVVASLLLAVNPACTKCAGDIAQKATEKAIETAIEKGTGGKVNIDAGSNIDLTGFPPELIYPGAKPTGKWTITSEEGTGATYVFETPATIKQVSDHFKTALAGWKAIGTMESNESVVLTFQTADEKQTAVITLSPKEGGGTTVGVVYSKK